MAKFSRLEVEQSEIAQFRRSPVVPSLGGVVGRPDRQRAH
jgi:hypothetical protein